MKNIFRFIPPKAGFLFVVSFLFAATNPLHAQWIQTNEPYANVTTLFPNDANLFAGTNGGGVFLSSDDGISWTAVNTGLTNTYVTALAASGTNLFAGTAVTGVDGVFLSTDNGTSWTPVNNGLTNTFVDVLAVFSTNLFAGTYGGVFLSTNNGTNWTPAGLTFDYPQALAVSGTNLFAGTSSHGVFLSTNNGTSWIEVNTGLTNTYVHALAVSGASLFAGTNGGIFLSTNNGTSWTEVNTGLTNTSVAALAVSDANLFAGTYGGVFLSTNNGTGWTEVNTGLTSINVYSLAVSGTNLFAGTHDSGVWRRPLSEMITSVEVLSTDLPTYFSLDQNYPNPFNPATTISFSLPSQSFVSLKVFDALGREVDVLLSEELTAGTYSQQWVPKGLSTGVYLYRLQAGNFVKTNKLILLR